MNTVTEARLSANRDGGVYIYRALSPEQRQQVIDILAAAGIDHNRCGAVTYDVIDIPLLRCEMYLDDEDGKPMLTEDGDDFVQTDVEIPCGELPTWWTPTCTEETQ